MKSGLLFIVTALMTAQLHGASRDNPGALTIAPFTGAVDTSNPRALTTAPFTGEPDSGSIEACKKDIRTILAHFLKTTPEEYDRMPKQSQEDDSRMPQEYKILYGHYTYLHKYSFEGLRINLFNLAMYYYRGKEEFPLDKNKAFQFFRHSGNLGCSKAQYHVGLMFERGDAVPKDYSEAFRWYKLAANDETNEKAKRNFERMCGSVFQYTTGFNYYYGNDGLTKDTPKAVEWFQRAAAQESPEAITALARLDIPMAGGGAASSAPAAAGASSRPA